MSNIKERCTKCTLIKIVLMMLFVIFCGTIGYRYFNKPKPLNEVPMQIATVLPHPRLVHPFTLKDEKGQAFTEANLKDQWSLVFFGFTSCPMMCPVTMAELGKVYQVLQMQGVKQLPQVIMVSIDPARDTPKKVSQYVKKYDPHFIGLTGDEKQLKSLTQELGIVYLPAAPTANGKPGDIDHSGTVVLINPLGEAAAFFSFPHDAKKIANDYRSITEYVS